MQQHGAEWEGVEESDRGFAGEVGVLVEHEGRIFGGRIEYPGAMGSLLE